MREHEISSGSGRVFENFEILEFIGIHERVGIRERIGNINNSLKPTPPTVSKDRRSRTIIRAIPSVLSFGLITNFRVSFCTCDKFYIDSVSFLVHVLMFRCICFKWRNKSVVSAYFVLNSVTTYGFPLCIIFFLKMFSNRASLYLLSLHDIFCTTSCFTLTITRQSF